MPRKILTADREEKIRERYRELPNIQSIAIEFGVSLSVAKHAIASRHNNMGWVTSASLENPIALIFAKITGGLKVSFVAGKLGLPNLAMDLFHIDSNHSIQWIKQTLIPKLLENFPDKAPEIKTFEVLACDFRPLTVHQIKNNTKSTLKDFREASGILLREMREACGLTVEEAVSQITHPLIKKNLPRIELCDQSLAASVTRTGIEVVSNLCRKINPQQAERYIPTLEMLGSRLRR